MKVAGCGNIVLYLAGLHTLVRTLVHYVASWRVTGFLVTFLDAVVPTAPIW